MPCSDFWSYKRAENIAPENDIKKKNEKTSHTAQKGISQSL